MEVLYSNFDPKSYTILLWLICGIVGPIRSHGTRSISLFQWTVLNKAICLWFPCACAIYKIKHMNKKKMSTDGWPTAQILALLKDL